MSGSRSHAIRWATALAVAGVAGVAGCKPPPPPQQHLSAVTVSRPVYREVVDYDKYSGYLASPESVEVRPRVSGQIVSDQFKEGAIVNKGDVLFRIDVRPFQADLDAKLASVKQAEADLSLKRVEFDRNAQAVASNAVSRTDYDTANANYQQSQAMLAGAKAAVEASRLNVEWSDVVAPIGGRVSYKFVTTGNIVTGGTAAGTLLTTIQSVDPMYCYVDVDENSVLKYKKLAAEMHRNDVRDAHVSVFMRLANEAGFPREGTIDFVNNVMDQTTGTQRFRGVFPNKDGFLAPGFFAEMRIPASERYKATLVLDSAVNTQQDLKFVYVIGKGEHGMSVAQFRPVVPGTLFGTMRAIVSGLGPDDLVVTNGTASIFVPNMPVDPKEAPMPADGFAEVGGGSATTRALPTTGQAPTPGNGMTPPPVLPKQPGTSGGPTSRPAGSNPVQSSDGGGR